MEKIWEIFPCYDMIKIYLIAQLRVFEFPHWAFERTWFFRVNVFGKMSQPIDLVIMGEFIISGQTTWGEVMVNILVFDLFSFLLPTFFISRKVIQG